MSSENAEESSVLSLSDLELRKELTRHGIEVGPIGPTTRKVYEKKLQHLLNGNGSIENGENLVNGMNGGGSPHRETTPLMSAEHNSSPKPSPRSSPAPDEQGNDDDEGPSESARLLTPREMQNFRRSFKLLDSPDSFSLRQRRECSPPLEDQNTLYIANGTNQKSENASSAVKRFGISLFILAVTGAFIVAMFWMRERLVPIFDGGANDVKKEQ